MRVVTVEPVGDNAITVYFKDSQGRLGEQMLFRSDEVRLELAQAGRPWSFDAPGADFKLGLEAYRINLAHLFDPMMAVHTSNVDPLPIRFPLCTSPCCLASRFVLSWLTILAQARPSWLDC